MVYCMVCKSSVRSSSLYSLSFFVYEYTGIGLSAKPATFTVLLQPRPMCSSIVKSLSCINRIFNILYALVGAALCKYGVTVLEKDGWKPRALSCTLVGVGGILALVCIVYASCGHGSRAFGCAYSMFMFSIFICNAALLGYAFGDEGSVIEYLNSSLPDIPSSWVVDRAHAQYTLFVTEMTISALSVSLLVAAAIAMCHRASLKTDTVTYNHIADDGYGDEEYSYDYVPPTATYRSNTAAQRGSGSEVSVVTSRFRDKYSDMYDKYGIQSG